jgi:hypothetical protein
MRSKPLFAIFVVFLLCYQVVATAQESSRGRTRPKHETDRATDREITKTSGAETESKTTVPAARGATRPASAWLRSTAPGDNRVRPICLFKLRGGMSGPHCFDTYKRAMQVYVQADQNTLYVPN